MARHMKQSGIDWLGDIPDDWEIQRGKNILILLERPVMNDDGVITCFRDGEVTLRINRREEGFTISDKEIGYQGIEAGDLVVHGMDGFAGAIGISDSRGKATPVLNVMDSFQNKRYLMYYLRCAAFCGLFLSLSTGIRVRSCDTNWNKLKNVLFLLPPIDEQERIAAYLDDKCSRIDSVISKTRASIEEYKKLKQAIITRAVTRGIRANRTLKQSGIDWIGEMNSNYSLKRIKYFISDYKAGPFGSALITGNLLNNGNILVYTPEHVAKQSDNISNNFFLPDNRREEMQQFFVETGHIVFPIVGSLGRAMYITSTMREGIINQRLAKFKLNEKVVDKNFFMYVFAKGDFYKQFLEVNSRGAIIVNLTKEIVHNMLFPLPPIDEQREIAAYLDEKTSAIDSLVAKKNQLVAELERLKKSLIFEYVTGKKEVAQ